MLEMTAVAVVHSPSRRFHTVIRALIAIAFILIAPTSAKADLPSVVNFVVLRVLFTDFPMGSRFTGPQVQTNFNSIVQLWGNTSYGNISLNFQIVAPYSMPKTSPSYLGPDGQSSCNLDPSNNCIDNPLLLTLTDAVANAPSTIDWSNVYGVIVLFSDNRPNGFYRGWTWGQTKISPPVAAGAKPISKQVFASVVGEQGLGPSSEDVVRTWGRWSHESGHQMQAGGPPHPSNYNSDFEQMDAEYPAQSGVFEKQTNTAFPNWLPTDKYLIVSPPEGASAGLLAEEQPPASAPLYQAIKAFLSVGAPKTYYLISLRQRVLGDELATVHGPNGIPDQGVLIERVVEGGDPWVTVVGKGGNPDMLWHAGDTYSNPTDSIFVSVRQLIDGNTTIVDVRYSDTTGQPDVGLNSWLEPPGNTYETTDIWIDSPVNGYGTYRYPLWSDLMGGMVPSGNGDDPAVGMVNRIYARVRNYGSAPATNVVVHFDITDPPGVGIAGSNGFNELGTVTSAQFPGLASIPAGSSVDVYLNWTPNFSLTPEQIMEGRFAFHTCIRVRIDHVAGETFFANQDGNGQQENIAYFQSGSPGAPGTPGAPNEGVVHLRNDDPEFPKQFTLNLKPETLPDTWDVEINNGNPIVNLGPGEVADVPVVVTQTEPEPVGSKHTFKIVATSQVTLTNEQRPDDLHNEMRPLAGMQMQVAVLRKTSLECHAIGNGRVQGRLTGTDTNDKRRDDDKRHGVRNHLSVLVVGVDTEGRFIPDQSALGLVQPATGLFTVTLPGGKRQPRRAVCLFSGTTEDTSAGSSIFPLLK
jgi:hypothetical protein